jgi:putative transposase
VTTLLTTHGAAVGLGRLSAALGVPRATTSRWRRPVVAAAAAASRVTPARALPTETREAVLTHLHAERFQDAAPAQVHATLLDEGTYLCSVRTMYRLLDTLAAARERRPQRTHAPCAIPRLVARAPNTVWTWDVTELRGPVKGERYPLYVVLDLFSRYVVAWMLARRESATLAKRLVRTAALRHGIVAGQLTTHSDRGSIQVAKDLHDLYQDLGIVRSLSRPRVSNDNPFSESQFKTLKYAPSYPARFDSLPHAQAWCDTFFQHYNHEHRHSGLAYLTPATVHHGDPTAVLAHRQAALDRAYQAHPERFVRGAPRVPQLPTEVWINRAEDQTAVVHIPQ